MNKIYNFDEQLEWMLKQRTLLDANFYPRIAYDGRWVVIAGSRGSAIFDKNHHVDVAIMVDGSVSRKINFSCAPHSLTIDEKLDSQNRYTIFFEEWSDKDKRKPGWGQPGISDADILLWAFKRTRPPGLKVYMFELCELIEWAWPRRTMYPSFDIPNEKWITFGYSIPIKGQGGIPEHIFFGKPDGYLVEQQLNFSL